MRPLVVRWARALAALYPPSFRARAAVDLTRLLTDGAGASLKQGRARLATYLLVNTVACLRDAVVEWILLAWRGLRSGVQASGLTRFPSELLRAVRALRRRPRFAGIVVLTLGVGVSAAGTVFALTSELLLRGPAGVDDPDGALFVMFGTPERPSQSVSGPAADEVRAKATLLDGLAAYETKLARIAADGLRPVDVQAAQIYGDYFELLGVRPGAGRLLSAEEIGPRADPALTVLSESLAARLFGSATAAVGQEIHFGDRTLTVVGVAAPGFRGTVRSWPVDVWIPISSNLDGYPAARFWSPATHPLQFFIARPAPGATTEAVAAQIQDVLERMVRADPEAYTDLADFRTTVHPGLMSPGEQMLVGAALAVLGAAALLLLLVTCANVANLLLVRGVHRRPDVALARALGASRWTIMRERVAESVVLAVTGVAAGLALTWLIGSTFRGLVLFGQPEFRGLALDLRIIGFAAAAVATTTMVFGVVPAVLSSRFDLTPTLREEGTQTTGRWNVLRSGVSALQIALSLLLLIGTALLGRSLRNLYAVDLGIDLNGVQAMTLDLGPDAPDPGPELDQLNARIIGAAQRVPGVQLASLHGYYGPYDGAAGERINRVDLPNDQAIQARSNWVSADWFELFRLPVVTGRHFTEQDQGGPFRVVLTAELATRLFGRTDVVGRMVKVGLRTFEEAEVVGVVGDVRLVAVDGPVDLAFFTNRNPSGYAHSVTLLFRSDDPSSAADVQRALEAALPEMPVSLPAPLAGRIDRGLSQQRLFAQVLGLFSSLATLLAAVGLFGVVSFAVAQRRRELGIRIALGADGRRIRSLVMRSALAILGLGLVGGLAAAAALSTLMRALLFGVDAVDPGSYVAATIVMGVVSLAACWIPAREALRTDPAAVLRRE